MSKISIRSPQTDDEWLQYYTLRWQLLRAPWQQPSGSEKDSYEDDAIHRLAISAKNVVAVGRAHFNDDDVAQLRYMAVLPEYRQQGIGSKLLTALEKSAFSDGAKTITLNARENAVDFYQQHGYQILQPAETLFGCIKHFKMIKQFVKKQTN